MASRFRAKLPVSDLHAITPSAYAEFGDAVVNTLSYQQARHFNVPARGVYVANPGYVFGAAGIPRGAVITTINSKKIDSSADFEPGIAALGDGDHATVRYITIDDPNGSQLRSIRMDRLWFPAHHCERDDALRRVGLQGPAGGAGAARPPGQLDRSSRSTRTRGSTALAPSLAMVTFDMPYSVSGITERNYHGTGLVVDAQRGLVVVDRNTVPVSRRRCHDHVRGHRPGAGPRRLHSSAAQPRGRRLRSEAHRRDAGEVREADAARAHPPASRSGSWAWAPTVSCIRATPRSRASIRWSCRCRAPCASATATSKSAQLVNPPLDFDGVLTDESGNVLGLWSSFAYESGRDVAQDNRGVPIDLVADMLDHVRTDKPLHSLEAELAVQPLASAREIGLSEDWVAEARAAESRLSARR